MIKLYLDENVHEAIASSLKLRGYDVITVKESGKKGKSDIEQLKYAASQNRVIFTFDIADFYKIHSELILTGFKHDGIILSKQLPVGTIVKALSKLLSSVREDSIKNNIAWLSDWID